MIHAGCYAGVAHYLRAIAAIGAPAAKDGAAVIAQMKRMDAADTLFGPGRIREDGRKIHDIHLFRVKTPAAAKTPWDLYDLIATTPGDQAFRPMAAGGCPLVPA
jgi:branched-chain amino acid transport system substrate-binding protein